MLAIIQLLVVLSQLPAAPSIGRAKPAELTFPTGEPEVYEFALRDRGHELLTWDEYVETFDAFPRAPAFIRIKKRPESLGTSALYGMDVVVNGRNLSFAAVPRAGGGFSIHVDANGNGDVLDDPALQTEIHHGHPSAVFRAVGSVSVDGTVHSFPFYVRFVIRRFGAGFQLEQSLGYQLRRGVIDDGQSRLAFALLGLGGTFDKDRDLVFIDRDGNGMQLTRDSRDQLLVADRRFDINGAAYTFRVDPLGRSLVLTSSAAGAAPRAALTPGTEAPSFDVVDISGRKQTLPSYRGRVVLLDFWATWCGPCRAEAPELAALHQKYAAQGLVLIGIAPETAAVIRAFQPAFGGAEWPQVAEPFDGPVHRAFRVFSYPTKFLIGKDGKIVNRTPHPVLPVLEQQIRKALGLPPGR